MSAQINWQAFDAAMASRRFGHAAFLTFCLAGMEAQLATTITELFRLGGANLEGADTGFINAKLPVQTTRPDIEACLSAVNAVTARNGVIIAGIDLDSDVAVERSHFANLSAAS